MLRDILRISTPLLLAAIGGLFTEIAGVLNIGLEGMMLAGAFAGAVAGFVSGSTATGVAAAAAAGLLMAAVIAVVTIELRGNIFVVGLSVNLLSAGITTLLAISMFGTKGVITLPASVIPKPIVIPIVHDLPVLGQLLSGHTVLTYFAFAVTAVATFVLSRSALGRGLRAAGSSPETLYVNGLAPERYRYWALLISGVLCGVAGATISLGLGTYVQNISAGRGWIALVAIYLGYKRAWGILIACVLFAAADYLASTMQGRLGIPPTVTLALPYLLTLAGLIVVAMVNKRARGNGGS